MVILGLDAVDGPVGVGDGDAVVRGGGGSADLFGGPEFLVAFVDQLSAGGIAIDDDFENVIVQIGAGEVPIAFVRLIQKIEPIFAFYPAHFDFHIEFLGIGGGVTAFIIDELIHADGVAVGDDVPVVGFGVDAGDFVPGKLKDLEGHLGAIECP